MRTRKASLLCSASICVLLLHAAAACEGHEEPGDTWEEGDTADDVGADTSTEPDVVDDTVEDTVDAPTHGEFLLLTYNVAGLPESLSSSHPEIYIPQISPLLNGYDLVVVQEDFWYHDELQADALHPYRSDPMIAEPTLTNMGDGLNRFSAFPFGVLERITWARCNGTFDCASDCLTTKGFSVATHELGGGLVIDVYNLHMDAGSCSGDFDARSIQVDQLIAEADSRSGGRAVIVAGDTNLSDGRPQDMVDLDRLIAQLGLTDSCRALGCGIETLDRVLFRSSDSLSLVPLEWSFAGEFVDPEGHDLSDHLAVMVHFRWEGI